MDEKIRVIEELNILKTKMEIQLKVGDNFMRISKYGKVFGIVKSISQTSVVDEKCNYIKLLVESTNGVFYDYNECYKVSKILNEEEIDKRKKFLDGLKILSERKYNILKEKKD
ncbi:MAG TPA: hypothetical protein PLD56_10440 [Chitinophagales bacterium]|nr:hypothetical protein [Chitinophagales bacterium]